MFGCRIFNFGPKAETNHIFLTVREVTFIIGREEVCCGWERELKETANAEDRRIETDRQTVRRTHGRMKREKERYAIKPVKVCVAP